MPPTFPPNATFTTRLGLPRPGLDDIADGPDAFNDLTDVLDPIIAGYAAGTTAARPAGYAGQFYWNTDTQTLQFYNGTAWGSASGSGAVGAALPILDVGVLNQRRAGRQLTAADFTGLGLSQPVGLWNLSDLTNLGSDGRALANKGAVPFGVGINGTAATSAVFSGSTSQALYIADSGASDPYRIKTGSWGCWFRTAKRGTNQDVMAKWSTTSGQFGYTLGISSNNVLSMNISTTGANNTGPPGVSDVCDDRWHFAVVTYDGGIERMYVDGVLEATLAVAGFIGEGPIFSSSAPLNIGGRGGDAATAPLFPFFGRVDEAFVTADVLSEDEIRCLYAARLTHTLGVAPTAVRLNVHRRRKGAAFAVTDFTTQPLRLYNFTNPTWPKDEGSNGVDLTFQSGTDVGGADGTRLGGFSYTGAGGGSSATDAGLPSALAARTYGCWFKTTATTPQNSVLSYGATGSGREILYISPGGALSSGSAADFMTNGPFVSDGQWHFAVVSEDNAAGDGVRRKVYLDGRLVLSSTVLGSIVLQGANRFRIGADVDGTTPFTGQVDGAFVCGYAMAQDEVLRLYAKSSQDLGASPKEAGAHVERVDASSVLFIGDTLESQSTVDLSVVA